MILDFHTHCFPDHLAPKAILKLEAAGGITAHHDGTLAGLIDSMDREGVDVSVVQHIVVRPGQERSVNTFAAEIQSDRVISFGSIHPDSPDWRDELRRLTDLGLAGVKLHPDYQGFYVDDERVFPLYEELCDRNLVVLFHAGIDVGLPDPCHCTPPRLARVVERFRPKRWIAAHMGGWMRWDEVEQFLIGKPIYLDTSCSLFYLGRDRARRLIEAHGIDRILFGTDSPWETPGDNISRLRSLDLGSDCEDAILSINGLSLLT